MKLKKVLSGFLSAAILATTTAIVMPMSASAEDVELSTSELSYTNLQKYESLTITYEPATVDSCGHDGAHSNATYCPWASVAIIGALENPDITINDKKSTNWYQPDSPATAGSGRDESPTSATVKVSTILNSFTSDSDWNDSYTLSKVQFSGWGATITKVVGTPKSGDTPVLKPVSVTIDEAEIEIPKNAWDNSNPENYNYQGTYELTVDGYTKESDTIADIDISTLTVKFPVASVTCAGNAIDPANVSYQINVKVHKDDDWSPWLVDGSSNYNASTKMVTVTADIESLIADTADDYVLNSFNLIAMVDKANATDTVTLKIGNEVAVESVTLDESALALKKGEEAQLTATVTPEGADQGVTWITSNNKVATITADGKVTAVASGTATITATSTADETKKAECEVTVTNPATAIAIDKTASVLVGAAKLLAVTTTPADADELTYTWTTSDASIATVADGVVTGVTAGTAKITVTAGALTASCDVTVTAEEKPITKLEISDATLELEEGKTGTLTSTTTPSDTTDEIEWVSSDPSVATVRDGVVTAVKAGKATITVQVKGNEEISASCEVTVTAKAPEIETKPYTLNVVDASGWGEAGVTRAAQVNVPVTTLNGFKVGTTTYKDVKDKTLKLENLAFGSCTAAGVKAENVDVCIYLQFGSGWTWCATGGNTLADGSVEYDLSTLASANGVKDTDVLQQIGFQFNIKGNVGGINDMAENTKVTLNAAEPKFTVVGEEPSNYETGKVETVEGYVPASTEAGKKTELVVMSITETEAARNDSYTITVSDGTKTYTTTTNDCYKGFKYNTATGEKTENAANGYFIIVKVTGVPEGTNITVTIEPTK